MFDANLSDLKAHLSGILNDPLFSPLREAYDAVLAHGDEMEKLAWTDAVPSGWARIGDKHWRFDIACHPALKVAQGLDLPDPVKEKIAAKAATVVDVEEIAGLIEIRTTEFLSEDKSEFTTSISRTSENTLGGVVSTYAQPALIVEMLQENAALMDNIRDLVPRVVSTMQAVMADFVADLSTAPAATTETPS